MKDLKELLEQIAESDDVEVEVHKFEPEEEYAENPPYEALVFGSGLTEAVRRLLKKHNDYDMVKYVRTILDAEYEGDEKGE